MSLFYFSGKWFNTYFAFVIVEVGVVNGLQSSRGSIAPANFASNNSCYPYVPALIFWVNGSDIRLQSLLEMMLLTENQG